MVRAETDFGRVITAMVTPFDQRGRLDRQGAARLAANLVRNRTDAIVVAGTTGESPTLTERDRNRLLESVLHAVGDSVPVIAGTGTNSTSESIRLSRIAEREGAHGLLLVTPPYNKPSPDGLHDHFEAVAESVGLPCMLYNVPGRTGTDMTGTEAFRETIFRLAEIPNIVGLKEAIGIGQDEAKRARFVLLIEGTPKEFDIWSGDDADTLWIVRNGGKGVVSVASHVAGNLIAKMIETELIGNREEAQALHEHLMPLFNALFPSNEIGSSPSSVKYVLNLRGMSVGGLRLPLKEVPDWYKEELQLLIADYEQELDPVVSGPSF